MSVLPMPSAERARSAAKGTPKSTVVANVAVARELAGWCWSLATLPD